MKSLKDINAELDDLDNIVEKVYTKFSPKKPPRPPSAKPPRNYHPPMS